MARILLKVAAKAVILNQKGQVLILRESPRYEEGTQIGRYHLPGGRLEDGESYTEGLVRESKEETGLEVEPMHPLFVGEWRPVIKNVPHQIIAIFTVCKAKNTKVSLSSEHDDFQWIHPRQAYEYDIMSPEPEVIKLLVERPSLLRGDPFRY